MRGEWTHEDIERAARNQLSFTLQQMELLRGSANLKPD